MARCAQETVVNFYDVICMFYPNTTYTLMGYAYNTLDIPEGWHSVFFVDIFAFCLLVAIDFVVFHFESIT